MNPTDLRWNITPIIITILGLLLAVFLGVFAGSSEISKLGLIFGSVAVIAVIASMRQYIWLLLPLCWGLTGSVTILPLPFSVRDMVVMLVGGVAFALFALRVFKFRNRWDKLDAIVILNLAQVVIAFVFHPAGLKALSSETVGARPYFNIAIAAVVYLVLCNQIISKKLALRIPILFLIPEITLSGLYFVSRIKPSIGFFLGNFYDALTPQTMSRNGPVSPMERMSGAVGGGITLVSILCSYFRPLTLISPIRLGRFLLFIIGIVLILLSGFRSQLLTAAVIFILSGYFRKGIWDVITSLAGLSIAAITLILFNSFIHPLPLAMQRTLSTLPGSWDSIAAKDAESSTLWRLEMWKDIPKGTQYIHNKIMGDGFGFSRAELIAMERQKFLTGEMGQEDSMIIGSFHSGPLSAVRFVGIVGLLLYYALLIYAAIYSWRVIRSSKGTDFFPLALFIGLRAIWEPFNYTLIFGAYDSGLPETLFTIGMLKMIHNSLQPYLPEEKPAEAQPRPGRMRRLAPA
jgi:hypothetical protein